MSRRKGSATVLLRKGEIGIFEEMIGKEDEFSHDVKGAVVEAAETPDRDD